MKNFKLLDQDLMFDGPTDTIRKHTLFGDFEENPENWKIKDEFRKTYG
jgi:hypothetical protein